MTGRERRSVACKKGDVERLAIGATAMKELQPPDGASRRVRLRLARTGNACARASLTTDARIGLLESGARPSAIVFGTRSPRSHTESGAENGKMTSAISQQAAVRAASESDVFV